MNALAFNSLPKDTLACRLEKPGIEPPILWLVADMVYLMSHSHPDEEKEEMSSTAFISLQFTHKYVIFPLLPWGELCRWNMFALQGHFQDVFKWGWHSEAQEPVGQPMENQKKSVRKKTPNHLKGGWKCISYNAFYCRILSTCIRKSAQDSRLMWGNGADKR